ncbi:siderophore-interacting protein [Microbacterium sediminicola]|uniref:Siderophore-interacting protein n=1 Tax=Microbacterium sediminicola TaxID=415210 RepID=A0ABN2HYU3_9MICO
MSVREESTQTVDDASEAAAPAPFIVARGKVVRIDRLSPNFARVSFSGPDLTGFGNPERILDQRIKLIFPPASGRLPDLSRPDGDWWAAFLAIPEAERGTMRTYSIRDLIVDGAETTVVVDFVMHLEPGLTGPASSWASGACVGDELLLIGPRRGSHGGGGIEYQPGDARTVVLAGDETAAPAIARILEELPREAAGSAYIEVPSAADVLTIDAPEGITVRWVPREGLGHGESLIPAVLADMGMTVAPAVADDGSEDLVWETPLYSGSGEELGAQVNHTDRYFWIAGESRVVTTLRRHLVKDLGIDRSQVAFMGYWRKGVAMRG